MNEKVNKSRGFTLVELIIVIGIIGILVSLALASFKGQTKKAKLTQIRHDIKVAEGAIDKYLINNHQLPDTWHNVSMNKLNGVANENGLYDIKGVARSVIDGSYKEINKDFLNQEINTKLDGTFYSNENGKVYYEDKNSSGDLFDREVEVSENAQGKIKILDYNLPNGIYTSGDTIKGNLKVEALQAGTYTLNADIIHSKTKEILNDEITFDINIGEIKDIHFSYNVTSKDKIGFYGLEVKISDEDELVKYNTYNSIYIAQHEWEYFYQDDFNEVELTQIGKIGALDPSKVSYNYVLEPITGIDYSNVTFNIDANDNKTGQVSTILPITYGTYEALIKVPDNDSLLNGFFLYGTDKHDENITYEIDMEILFHEDKWQLWTTIFNETHDDYNGEAGEPGVIFHKQINLNFDPSKDFHSYRIDFYKNYVTFALDGEEVARWNNSFEYGDMRMYAGTFYTHWLAGKLSSTPLEMNVKWMRRGYFPQ